MRCHSQKLSLFPLAFCYLFIFQAQGLDTGQQISIEMIDVLGQFGNLITPLDLTGHIWSQTRHLTGALRDGFDTLTGSPAVEIGSQTTQTQRYKQDKWIEIKQNPTSIRNRL